MRMPATGIEPVLCHHNRILSPARLPVPPRRHLMGRGGFEPPKQFAADLQSVPFGHSGICPLVKYALTKIDYSIPFSNVQVIKCLNFAPGLLAGSKKFLLHNFPEQFFQIFNACVFWISRCTCICVCRLC